MANPIQKAADIIGFLLKLVGYLPEMVQAAEMLIPQSGAGPVKLLLVMEQVAEIALQVEGLDFQRIRRSVENIIAAIVRAMNTVKGKPVPAV